MIHPSAVVSNNAKIDETTNIGPFCIVGDGVKIGKNNNLISHVSIIGNTIIENNEVNNEIVNHDFFDRSIVV